MTEKCPNCKSEDFYLNPQNRLLGLTGGWFCPDCGFRESVGKHDNRIKAKNATQKKLELVLTFDEILKQINDGNIVMMLNEWKSQLVHFLSGV